MATATTLAASVLARLRLLPALTVLDGWVGETPVGAYAVLYDDAPRPFGNRHVGVANRLAWTFRVVCAGRDPNEARHVAGLVLGALTNWRVNTDPATSWITPIPDGAPILPDKSVPGDIRYSQTLVFTLTTTRS